MNAEVARKRVIFEGSGLCHRTHAVIQSPIHSKTALHASHLVHFVYINLSSKVIVIYRRESMCYSYSSCSTIHITLHNASHREIILKASVAQKSN